ncbi:hypothetical protein [Scytonema sp. PRP1]|uniref:hypothetical protein n=1 Tax=Scytonema sp. PRP1 TaxID=3120513 RepID=UPI002FD32E35
MAELSRRPSQIYGSSLIKYGFLCHGCSSLASTSLFCDRYNKAIAALKAGEKITSAYNLRNFILSSELPDWVKESPVHQARKRYL